MQFKHRPVMRTKKERPAALFAFLSGRALDTPSRPPVAIRGVISFDIVFRVTTCSTGLKSMKTSG